MTLWIKGADDREIGRELSLDADAGRKLRRSAVATLRRWFRDAAGDGSES